MAVKTSGTSSPAGDLQQRHSRAQLGCWTVIIAIIALVATAFIGSFRENAKWRHARPEGMTEQKWAALREECEAAQLDIQGCATTPEREIDRLARDHRAADLKELCARDDEYLAIKEAEEIVRTSLKSPSSARFASNPRVQHEGCRWTISGEVDAQNSFGAMLRSDYRVKLQRTAEEIWLPLSIHVSE